MYGNYRLSGEDQQLFEKVIERSMTDATFRQRLLNDPQPALQEATGFKLPASIRFTEKPDDVDIFVVLPDAIANATELTPEELEAVAGGGCWWTCVVTGDIVIK
jgi:hypothetical protein